MNFICNVLFRLDLSVFWFCICINRYIFDLGCFIRSNFLNFRIVITCNGAFGRVNSFFSNCLFGCFLARKVAILLRRAIFNFLLLLATSLDVGLLLRLYLLEALDDGVDIFLNVFKTVLTVNAHFSGEFPSIRVQVINVANLLDSLVFLPLTVRHGSLWSEHLPFPNKWTQLIVRRKVERIVVGQHSQRTGIARLAAGHWGVLWESCPIK